MERVPRPPHTLLGDVIIKLNRRARATAAAAEDVAGDQLGLAIIWIKVA